MLPLTTKDTEKHSRDRTMSESDRDGRTPKMRKDSGPRPSASLPLPPNVISHLSDDFSKNTGTQSSSSQTPLPPNWIMYLHPSGWRYYHNPSLRLVTDFTMDIAVGQDEYRHAQELTGGEDEFVPEGWEKLIDTGIVQPECLYVNHAQRRAVSQRPSSEEKFGDGFNPDIQSRSNDDWNEALRQEATYWAYMVQHPCHAKLPRVVEEEAIALLTYYAADRTISPEDSIVVFSKDTASDLLDLMKVLKEYEAIFSTSTNEPLKTLILSRLMERIVDEKRRQRYGHQDARRHLRRGLRGRAIEETKLVWPLEFFLDMCMTVFCFGAPYSYQRRIDEFFITALGRTDTISEKWRKFVDENVGDWTNTNLVATVFVSGAVSLLAVPGLAPVSRVLGFLSILSALASLVTGLLNSWQHQHESHRSLELTIILDFFAQAQKPLHTFKILALILALPVTFLGWAALTFAAAIVVLAWQGIDPTFLNNLGITDPDNASVLEFGPATAWVTTVALILVIFGVFNSYLFFLNVWSPPGTFRFWHKKKY